MINPSLPLTEFHHPATFQSRGVAVPFTAPLLAGARARASKRSGIEFVVPNPSGGRGVYILEWPGIRALCAPTVHDTALFEALSRLTRIEPAAIRDAALQVASQGLAGRAAAAAAETARAADHAQRLLAHFQFLARLVEQAEPDGPGLTALAERPPDFDRRASIVLNRLAPSCNCAAAHLANGVAALSDLFAPLGIASDNRTARIPRLLDRLHDTGADLADWLGADTEHDVAGLGRAVNKAMKTACVTGKILLTDTRQVLADPTGLLRQWVAGSGVLTGRAARCEWLLDGWETLCLLWNAADSDASRHAAILEIAQSLPVLPTELKDWGMPAPTDPPDEAYRVVSHDDAWRRGAKAIAMIQRNEALRARIT